MFVRQLQCSALTWAKASQRMRKVHASASGPGPPAHLIYNPSQLPDTATLLLVARSAASSGFTDHAFWEACSLQARKLCSERAGDANLNALASYTVAAAAVRHRDNELMHLEEIQRI